MYLPKVHVEICPANLFSRHLMHLSIFPLCRYIFPVYIFVHVLCFLYILTWEVGILCTVLCLAAQSCWTLWPHGLHLPGSFVHGHSLGKNTGVGCHALLQGILPAQGSDPGLLYCSQVLYWLSHRGSPRILEWVACLISRGSSRPRNQTQVSYIAGIFFTSWATRETPLYPL